MDAEVIFVDDEVSILNSLRRILKNEPYTIFYYDNPLKALEKLQKTEAAVVISDYRMPDMNGVLFFEKVREMYPDTSRIILTGNADMEIVINAINKGNIFRFMQKPINSHELKLSVKNALDRYNLLIENKQLLTLIQKQNEELEAKVDERTKQLKKNEKDLRMTLYRLKKTLQAVIHAMALALDARDPYTAGHQRRVAEIAYTIAIEMGFTQDEVNGVQMAGLVHDLGKLSVPGEILSKPGRLTDNELNIIKTHSQVGYDILKDIDFPWPIARIILQHHERMNGTGYPQGLTGDKILIEARIIAVADVYEAMVFHRPYRAALGATEAMKEIKNNRGILYDQSVVDAFIKVYREGLVIK